MKPLNLVICLAAVTFGCSGDPEPSADSKPGTDDMGTSTNGADGGGSDAGFVIDPGGDADAGCTDCDGTTAQVTINGLSLELERAYYGITAPAQTDSGEWELHIEAHRGGGAGCPTQSSSSPDQTVIITNVVNPTAVGKFTEDDGLAVSFLDFKGQLTTEVVLAATSESIDIVEWEICTDCTEQDPDGFISIFVDAPIQNGSITGAIRATHCASMNVLN